MRVLKIVSVLLLAGLSTAAAGQLPPGGGPPGFAPGFPGAKTQDQEAQTAPPALESQVIAQFKSGPVTLDDLLTYLKDTVPGFNSVVIRSTGIPNDYPTLPDLSLKNVTVGQVLELLRTSYPGVSIHRIDGKGPSGVPLYAVRIEMSGGPGMIGGYGMPPGIFPAPTEPPKPLVKVYRLNEIIANLNGGSDAKKSMDDVLSLVQAALDETGDSQEKVVLKVHQQTQTLVFKGSPEKMAVLEQALDALRPKECEQIAKMEGQVENVKQQYQNLAEQSDRQQQLLRNDLAERQALEEQVLAMKAELTQAQIELKATKQPTTRP